MGLLGRSRGSARKVIDCLMFLGKAKGRNIPFEYVKEVMDTMEDPNERAALLHYIKKREFDNREEDEDMDSRLLDGDADDGKN